MIPKEALPATIANGASLSNAIDLEGYDLIAIAFPAAWTAAAVTFQASHDGVTYFNVYDSGGTEVSYAGAAADRWVMVNSAHLGMFGRFLKVRSGTAGVPVNQGAERVLKVIGRSLV